MKNIQSEIREYILSHDFVMLPGIGAFVAEYSQPYINNAGEIAPSERKIRFNALLRNDSDVDILQVFREKMNVSDVEIQELYFNFLDTVNEQLATFNRYYREDFGILISDGPGTVLQFLPFQPSVKADSIAKEEVSEVVHITAPAKDEISEEAPEDFAEERGGNALKYLVFALPLALLSAALVYMVFFKPSLRENVKEEQVMDEAGFHADEVTVDTLYMEQLPDSVNEAHIVSIGIYKRSGDADKIKSFLVGKGYPAKIRPHGPLFKVYLVADTEEQAFRYIKEVERLIDDTPIYERKKKNG